MIQAWFAWPDGGIWSNLVASGLWAVAGSAFTLWRVRRHLANHHAGLVGALRRAYGELDEHVFRDGLPDLGPDEGETS